MTVTEFWQEKKAKEAELAKQYPEGYLYVTSVRNREKNSTEGAVAQVSVDQAARLFTMGTHRESTGEEIKIHQAREMANFKAAREAEVRAGRADPVTVAATIAAALRKMEQDDAQAHAPAPAGPGPVKAPVKEKQ